jgi:hypothetical protein
MAEFWNVMTRPKTRNGFEFSMFEAEREIRAIESGMTLLPDNATVYSEWRRIVVQYGVSGVQVHDARLAAAMYVCPWSDSYSYLECGRLQPFCWSYCFASSACHDTTVRA